MKPDFALSLSFDGITLLHRTKPGWNIIGTAKLDSAALESDVADIRRKALSLDSRADNVKLVIPNEQIKFIKLLRPDGAQSNDIEAVILDHLQGATPYHVSELRFDWIASKNDLYVAAVAIETLQEAENFAETHSFKPLGNVAIPPKDSFIGEAFFGTALGGQQQMEWYDQEIDISPSPSPEALLKIAPKPLPPEPPIARNKGRITAQKKAANPDPKQPRLSTQLTKQINEEAENVPVSLNDLGTAFPRILSQIEGKLEGQEQADKPTVFDVDETRITANAASPSADPILKRHGFEHKVTTEKIRNVLRHTKKRLSAGVSALRAVLKTLLQTALRQTKMAGVGATQFIKICKHKLFVEGVVPLVQRLQPILRKYVLKARDWGLPVMLLSASVLLAGFTATYFIVTRSADPSTDLALKVETVSADADKKIDVLRSIQELSPAPEAERRRGLTGLEGFTTTDTQAKAEVFSETPLLGLSELQTSAGFDLSIVEKLPMKRALSRLDSLATPSSTRTRNGTELAPEAKIEIPQTARSSQLNTPEFIPNGPMTPEELRRVYVSTGVWPMAPKAPYQASTKALEDLYIASIDADIRAHDPVILQSPDEFLTDSTKDLAIPLLKKAKPLGLATGDPAIEMPNEPSAKTLVSPNINALRVLPDVTLRPPSMAPQPLAELTPSIITQDSNKTAISQPDALPSIDALTRLDPPSVTGFGNQATDPIFENAATENAENQSSETNPTSELVSKPPSVSSEEDAIASTDPQTPQAPEPAIDMLAQSRPLIRPQALVAALRAKEKAFEEALNTSIRPKIRPALTEIAQSDTLISRLFSALDEGDEANVDSPIADEPSSARVSERATLEKGLNLRKVNLLGTYRFGNSRKALILMPNGSKRMVKVGDRLDGGQVAAIDEEELRYIKSGLNIILSMPSG
ncbi:MAG: hypothetical protein HOK44_05350 [Rhodobacteraceae bacterium]|jgi:hypothetical protein|nr:hypothetical protein [Paracoccaceae bacterium]MBT5317705.1 hypothetical protein [Paracoccaceae bacterium]MBT5473717.1 hypothetical protein [Paracoccaceae bacterium]